MTCQKVIDYILSISSFTYLRRNKLLRKVTRSEVESVVKLWLRYAVDRSGGPRPTRTDE